MNNICKRFKNNYYLTILVKMTRKPHETQEEVIKNVKTSGFEPLKIKEERIF